MDILIWIGAALTLLGVGMLIWVILSTLKARKAAAEDEAALKAALQRMAAWNMGALALSAIGLMMVVIGIALG